MSTLANLASDGYLKLKTDDEGNPYYSTLNDFEIPENLTIYYGETLESSHTITVPGGKSINCGGKTSNTGENAIIYNSGKIIIKEDAQILVLSGGEIFNRDLSSNAEYEGEIENNGQLKTQEAGEIVNSSYTGDTGGTITNTGTIENNGYFRNAYQGIIINKGTITNNGTIDNTRAKTSDVAIITCSDGGCIGGTGEMPLNTDCPGCNTPSKPKPQNKPKKQKKFYWAITNNATIQEQ